MHVFRWALVAAVIFVLVNPTEAWRTRRFRRRLKRVGKSLQKVAKKLKLCDVFFGIGCPALASVGAAAIAGGTGGTGAVVAAVGAKVGKAGCKVMKKRCKRSVVSDMILLPFSDNFAHYDQNGDKLISYEEFTFAVMNSLPMAHPEELTEPFVFADLNGDDHLDTDEFLGAPFLFAHVNDAWQNVNLTVTVPSTLNVTDDGTFDMFSNETTNPTIKQKPVV